MTNVLDITLIQLALHRKRMGEMPGLFAMQAPFRAARGRSGDTLVVHLSFDGTLTFDAEEHQKLVERIAEKYFKISGSSTSATRSVAEWLNHFLVERNQRGASRSIQSAGLLTQIVLRGDRLYLAQCGPTHTFLIKSTGLSHYHLSNLAWRGLGFTRAPEIRYHQAVVKPGDIVLISPDPPTSWDRVILDELVNLPMDEMVQSLVTHGGTDFEAGLIVVESGSGKLVNIDPKMILELDQLPPFKPISMEEPGLEVRGEVENGSETTQQVVSKKEESYHQGILPFDHDVGKEVDLVNSEFASQDTVSSDSQLPQQHAPDDLKISSEKTEGSAPPKPPKEGDKDSTSASQEVDQSKHDKYNQGKIITEVDQNSFSNQNDKWSDLPRWTWLLVVGVLLIGIIGLIFLIFQGLTVFSPDIAGMILPSETYEVGISATVIPSSPTLATETSVAIISTPTPTSTMPSPTDTPTATPTPKFSIGSTQISPVDGMVSAYIPAGIFEMGASEDDTAALRDERPQHSVNLGAFWMDQAEVTNGQYALCVEEGECRIPYSATSYTRNPYYGIPDFVDFPVVFVTWNDARDYCQWAGRRLPTEAEWEKTARGQEDRLYPWGSELDCDLANFRECLGDTAEAISFPDGASPYGVLNLAGNVWEWVADWYYFAYYDFAPFENPTGPPSGAYRVIRGGSFNDDPIYLRTSSRYWYYPDNARFSVGFRCAISEYP